jgi:hypothetical protein
MPWLLNEDEALKKKLQGLIIPATNGDQSVAVRFKNPEDELAGFTFPLILISHGPISRAEEREHRGHIELPYSPEGYPEDLHIESDLGHTGYFTDYPIPYNLDYVVEVYSRFARDDRRMLATLSGFDYLPDRFGYLEIPEDGTIRRLDVIGGPETSEERDGNNKRLFLTSFVIRVSSELTLAQIEQLTKVGTVTIDIVVNNDPDHLYS